VRFDALLYRSKISREASSAYKLSDHRFEVDIVMYWDVAGLAKVRNTIARASALQISSRIPRAQSFAPFSLLHL